MTTEQQTVADLLRPLAERTVPCPADPTQAVERHWDKCDGGCGGTGTIQDPRFEALRPDHIPDGENLRCERCRVYFWDKDDPTDRYGGRCLDTSLGAMTRSAAACGVLDEVLDAIRNAYSTRWGWAGGPEEAGTRSLHAEVHDGK